MLVLVVISLNARMCSCWSVLILVGIRVGRFYYWPAVMLVGVGVLFSVGVGWC